MTSPAYQGQPTLLYGSVTTRTVLHLLVAAYIVYLCVAAGLCVVNVGRKVDVVIAVLSIIAIALTYGVAYFYTLPELLGRTGTRKAHFASRWFAFLISTGRIYVGISIGCWMLLMFAVDMVSFADILTICLVIAAIPLLVFVAVALIQGYTNLYSASLRAHQLGCRDPGVGSPYGVQSDLGRCWHSAASSWHRRSAAATQRILVIK